MKKTITSLLLICFSLNTLLINLFSCMPVYAQNIALPEVGTMLSISDDYTHPILKGIEINPENPLELSFNIDTYSQDNVSKSEVEVLVSYFLAALTIDKKDIWVNLSPYEQNRITNNNLAKTNLGKDLLEQDYILKQLSASLTHPATQTGKDYWGSVDANDDLVNRGDLSKIWIVPETAVVNETSKGAYVDQLSFAIDTMSELDHNASLKSIVSEVNKEVNSGKNFSKLRQIFHSIVLAQWFKEKLKDSLFADYINKNKTTGIEIADKNIKDKIWNQYVESFKAGAYNYVDKVKDPYNGALNKRKFFCGGINSSAVNVEVIESAKDAQYVGKNKTARVKLFSADKGPKAIGKELFPTFYKGLRYWNARRLIKHAISPADLLNGFQVFLEYQSREKLVKYAGMYSAIYPRSYVELVVACFAFKDSKEYLLDNLEEFKVLLKANWTKRNYVFRLFGLITDNYYWKQNDINKYTPAQLAELAKDHNVRSKKSLNAHEYAGEIYSSAIDADTLGYIVSGVLLSALTVYELFIKNNIKVDNYLKAKEAYEKIWQVHSYDYINSHKNDQETHDVIKDFLKMKHYAMAHIAKLDQDKGIFGDKKEAITSIMHKMERDYKGEVYTTAMNLKNAKSRFAALYVLRNNLQSRIERGLPPIFNLYGKVSHKQMVKKIKAMTKDKDEAVNLIASDILDNYINASSSAIKEIYADILIKKYIRLVHKLRELKFKQTNNDIINQMNEIFLKIKRLERHSFKSFEKLLRSDDNLVKELTYALLTEMDSESKGLNFILPRDLSSNDLIIAIDLALSLLLIARENGVADEEISVNVLSSYYGNEAEFEEKVSTLNEHINLMLDKYQRIWPNEKVNIAASKANEILTNGGISSDELVVQTHGSGFKFNNTSVDNLSGFSFVVQSID